MHGLNVERLHKLADVIEAEEGLQHLDQLDALKADKGFDMRHVKHVCGSPSCIAGYALQTFGDPVTAAFGGMSIAAELLGGVYGIGDDGERFGLHRLFMPAPRSPAWHATPAQAAQVIRHLADTGEINWDKFVPAKEEEK